MGEGKKVVICMDVRISSPELKKNAMLGLLDSGVRVIDMGIAPTPVVHFAVSHYKLDGGIMITASHNPKEWNGFKFYKKGSEPIGIENGLEEIKKVVWEGTYEPAAHLPCEDKADEILEGYEQFLLDKTKAGRRVRIGVDPGNGSYSGIARRIFEKMGAEVFTINDERNGEFPSRSPEPKEESLSELVELVLEKKLDFGIAFDADGDRGVFVEGNGKVLRGDRTLAILAKNIIGKGQKLWFDVSCTDAVRESVEANGGIPVVTRIGRTFVSKKMAETGAVIGGELSGHTYFTEMYYADDPMFAGLKMIELVSGSGKSLVDMDGELPDYKSATLELQIDDSVKFKVMKKIAAEMSAEYETITIDGIKVRTDEGWFIIRASNTTPMIKVVAEARNDEALQRLIKIPKEAFNRALSSI